MISPEHLRLMASYNRWQNESLYREAEAIGDLERRLPRGSYFSSIHGTLSHLMWGDGVWLHRFAGTPKPEGGIKQSASLFSDWEEMAAARRKLDASIEKWAAGVSTDWLGGDMSWFSGAAGRDVSKPNWFLAAHFFNHQTHHRGQVHAMITAAGGRPDDTDLFLLPGSPGA